MTEPPIGFPEIGSGGILDGSPFLVESALLRSGRGPIRPAGPAGDIRRSLSARNRLAQRGRREIPARDG